MGVSSPPSRTPSMGREPGATSSVDLTPWLDSPTVHELVGYIREVRDQ